MKTEEEIKEEIAKLDKIVGNKFDTDEETQSVVLAAGGHDALRWALGFSDAHSVSETLE